MHMFPKWLFHFMVIFLKKRIPPSCFCLFCILWINRDVLGRVCLSNVALDFSGTLYWSILIRRLFPTNLFLETRDILPSDLSSFWLSPWLIPVMESEWDDAEFRMNNLPFLHTPGCNMSERRIWPRRARSMVFYPQCQWRNPGSSTHSKPSWKSARSFVLQE